MQTPSLLSYYIEGRERVVDKFPAKSMNTHNT